MLQWCCLCCVVLCCAYRVVALKPCCVERFVMYGSSVFSSVFAITERSEMGDPVCMMCLCAYLYLVLESE